MNEYQIEFKNGNELSVYADFYRLEGTGFFVFWAANADSPSCSVNADIVAVIQEFQPDRNTKEVGQVPAA